MKKNSGYKFLTLFSPLDLATILYVLVSGIYICFSTACFKDLLPHFLVRALVLIIIASLVLISVKLPHHKLILFIRNLYPLLFLGFFYAETYCMKNIIFDTNLDPWFYNMEQRLWNCQPSMEFSKHMHWGWFNELMNICYFSYYALIGAACIVLYLKKVPKAQKGIFTIIFSFYLYYLIFAILPVAGPLSHIPNAMTETPPYFFGKLMQVLLVHFEKPTAAFPSSHVGIALIIAYVTYNHLRGLFFIILPFVIGICFATVYIKAHYLVDVIGGIISAPLFIILSRKIYNKFLPCTTYYYEKAG
ncbi:MAG: phosphatase PAP2 family protein [Bacteroidota bacterium]